MPDFILFEAIEMILGICTDKRIFTSHPQLEAFHNRMKALPAFAAHLASPQCLKEPFFPSFVKVTVQMPQ